MDPKLNYDPRYLRGILLFNERDFFAAHDEWEEVWREESSDLRRFVKGLIHAAVAAYHASNGNRAGAVRLFRSGRAYMEAFPPGTLGIDPIPFWERMAEAFAPLLDSGSHEGLWLPDRLPVISLSEH